MDNKAKYKVVYIHGRPTGHPIHDMFANILKAEFKPVDFILPWHENPNSYKIKRYLSWLLCALFFPNRKKYSVFFTESIREPILIMKLLGLISSRQKLIPLMDNETLFFYHNNRYSKIVMWMIKKYLEKSDAIICVGEFQSKLAEQIIGKKQFAKIRTVNNWVFKENYEKLSKITSDLNSKKILFIGDVSAEFRAWYKGVDLMIKAFDLASKVNTDITLEIVGINDVKYLDSYLSKLTFETRNKILIKSRQPIFSFLETASLYLHCARGEAWGITIMEALTAGVPVICSDLTGAKEVVVKVSPELIVPTNELKIAEKIIWFFNLPYNQRLDLSHRGREVMKDYTEEKSIDRFKKAYEDIENELFEI